MFKNTYTKTIVSMKFYTNQDSKTMVEILNSGAALPVDSYVISATIRETSTTKLSCKYPRCSDCKQFVNDDGLCTNHKCGAFTR